MQAHAIVFPQVNAVELRPITLRDPAAGEVLVEVEYTCISPGTECRCLRGGEPAAQEFPFIPGYSTVGRISAKGANVALPIGTRVYCRGTAVADGAEIRWGGQVSHAITSAEAVYPLAEWVDPLEASLAAMAAIAFHGLRLSRPFVGEKVAVVGLGIIGQLAARLHACAGAHVVASDLSPERVACAQAAGVEAIVPTGTLQDAFAPFFPEGADIVIDATGAPSVLPEAMTLGITPPWDNALATGARFLIQGSYERDIALPYRTAFERQMTFLTPRDCQPRDLLAILDLLTRRQLAIRDLVSEVRTPDDAPAAYAALCARGATLMTVAFDWSKYHVRA
ncbi:MAG TPA: zinc-binding dehydrogenase [Armatimonadota bacterium]|jgi:3-hydroxyethyl bacteriochlorophyllide a dehydrogenase